MPQCCDYYSFVTLVLYNHIFCSYFRTLICIVMWLCSINWYIMHGTWVSVVVGCSLLLTVVGLIPTWIWGPWLVQSPLFWEPKGMHISTDWCLSNMQNRQVPNSFGLVLAVAYTWQLGMTHAYVIMTLLKLIRNIIVCLWENLFRQKISIRKCRWRKK